MGLDKFVSNIFKASPVGFGMKQIDKMNKEPAASTENKVDNAAKDEQLRAQGRMNPLIATTAQGVVNPAEASRKMLLGQ